MTKQQPTQYATEGLGRVRVETLINLVEKPISGEWGSEGKGIKVIRSTNFTNEGVLNLDNVIERDIPQKKIESKLLKKGDIVIEKSGGSPNQPVGRVVFFDCDDRYLFSNFTSVLRPKAKVVYPKYLHYILFATHKIGITNLFQNKTTGILNLQLNRYIQKIKIPLPPLPIQRKIAEVLDRADALRQRHRQIIAHYDQLAQSVFLNMFGDPVTNQKGWDIEKLQSFGNWKSGGTPSRKTPEYFDGSIPWLSSGELENIFLSESNEHITEEAVKKSAASIVEPYSLLLGMYDTAALKSTINTVACSCNQAIAFAKINPEKANTVFLYYLIQIGKQHYRRLQRGVRQKNMNLSMIKSMPVLSPPLNHQNQFAEIIQRVETQKQQQQQALAKSEELFQSLLQRAFRGELFTEAKAAQQMEIFT